MAINNFLPFSPNDTGTNLLTQSQYNLATDRDIGNQPGVASSKLNNKALRQATFVVSQLAQFVSNQSNVDVLDDAIPAKLLGQIAATLSPIVTSVDVFTAGSGTYKLRYVFFIGSGNATAGATYTNNSQTFTVLETIAAQTVLVTNSAGAPTSSGILTKSAGTGDASLTFYAVRTPLALEIEMVGGGGGGGGAGTAGASAGSDGTDTTFGTALLVAGKGLGGPASGGSNGPLGGTASLGTGPEGIALPGGAGGGCQTNNLQYMHGGAGGNSAFGGGGGSSGSNISGVAGATNTGGGGSGGSTTQGSSNAVSGAGGSSGGYIYALIKGPASSYAYSVGTGGTAGGAGTDGFGGADGGSGLIVVKSTY